MKHTFLLLVINFHFAISDIFYTNNIRIENQNFHWGWSCNNEKEVCQRSAEPIDFNLEDLASLYVKSQRLCKLTCGRYGPLWPRPRIQTSLSKTAIPFHPSKLKFRPFIGDENVAKYLKEFESLFLEKLDGECNGCQLKSDNQITVILTVKVNSTDLIHKTDESYILNITYDDEIKKGINLMVNITGMTIFGVRHGLETLSQLIVSNKTLKYHDEEKNTILFIIRKAFISDKPAYFHRGLLIDTARNFLSISTIKSQINGMSMSKMNVLHWHATDTQSFPIVFPSVPSLARYGAYSDTQTYSFYEIQELLDYAKLRGVRIIMEIDAPAHAGNGWQFGAHAGLGDLAVCVNRSPWRQYCIQPPCGQLNPINKNVYLTLGKLYSDLAKIFPKGEFFHMGGDELFIPCWNSTQEILDYMSQAGMGRDLEDFIVLWGEYQEKALNTFNANFGNSSIILWSSTLTEPAIISKFLDRIRYIIQTWVRNDDPIPNQLIAKGYDLIISTKNAWYLDHGFWGNTRYYTWRTVYENQIIRHRNVLGGEVCMWGEYTDDSTIDGKVWPRAAAAGERLWTDSEEKSGEVETRFFIHRERLVEAGIKADAITPEWCVQNEGSCS
ncbi:chitooligosaccharidolytic beta-N-acetylglucosaminidase [Onthophagus taurus]|uniref:chitooligosaccharidolytic beta-N-acetylglucosaminidase n=1 Tax=Onthophagus taurus TaxID=166361 RepID=UPI000C20537C|nr:chitooligosaccharidolytic beta-N-acetylglucosaminidase-like [Onthophagus taurus]XP_022910205.1 chitooligosaccharidolytic beta-N-acetylglucosaminidase-like [Onthophagus taurus]